MFVNDQDVKHRIGQKIRKTVLFNSTCLKSMGKISVIMFLFRKCQLYESI